MKMKKLLISAMAVSLISVSVLTGCANNPPAEESSETSTAVSDVSADKENTKTSSAAEDSEKTDESSAAESSEPSGDIPEESSETEPVSTITPAVWEVTDQYGNNIYMMGSIHMADKEAAVLPDYFESAYAKCDALAVECDITQPSNPLALMNDFMYMDGSTIRNHVSAESYNKAVETLKKVGLYSVGYDSMKPILWVEAGELGAAAKSGLSADYGVDMNLIKRAKAEGKEILEVESMSFQNSLLTGLDEEIQLLLFESLTAENYVEESVNQLKTLYEHWKAGTITTEDTTDGDSDTELTPEQEELLRQYNATLLDDRNVGMAEAAESYMKDGKKVMFVVGAAHFYGEKGILSLLEQDGCTIRQLTHADASPVSPTEETETSAEESSELLSLPPETDPGIPRAA